MVSGDHRCCISDLSNIYSVLFVRKDLNISLESTENQEIGLWHQHILDWGTSVPGMLEIQQLDKTVVKANLEFQMLLYCRELDFEELDFVERIPL